MVGWVFISGAIRPPTRHHFFFTCESSLYQAVNIPSKEAHSACTLCVVQLAFQVTKNTQLYSNSWSPKMSLLKNNVMVIHNSITVDYTCTTVYRMYCKVCLAEEAITCPFAEDKRNIPGNITKILQNWNGPRKNRVYCSLKNISLHKDLWYSTVQYMLCW